jgi:serine/threonine protein kinase
VPVYELGRDAGGRPYFVMKKLAGTTLAAILAGRSTVPRQRVLRAFADVCLAVELAHRRDVIHRDLKPDNIMLGDFGETYVLDWGVAKVLDEAELAADTPSAPDLATAAGSVVGTPGYMAPEQARGDAIDARADVYSLGCVLFEILAGQPLHPRGPLGLASALGGTDGRPSSRIADRDIPPELDELCAQATAADREARIATARELGERVQRYLDGDRDLTVRRSLAAGHLDASRRRCGSRAATSWSPRRCSAA